MAINNDNYAFKHLVEASIPEYYETLQSQIDEPISFSEFSIKGVGVVGLTKCLNLVSDFQVCYVLIEKIKPIYVGISRSVLQRLQQPVKGITHFDASLVYRMASKICHIITQEAWQWKMTSLKINLIKPNHTLEVLT